MSKDKKKFRDTTVGKFLTENAPDVLATISDTVDDYFPPVKIITTLLKGTALPPEKQIELEKLLRDYELEYFQLEVQDKQNARAREIEIAKAGRTDWLMKVLGAYVLVAFSYFCYASVYMIIPAENREMFLDLKTTARDAMLILLSYHFGSSKGSADKTKMLKG